MVRTRLKSLINIHILFLFYSTITVVSKTASGYPFLSKEFIAYYGMELVMIAIYAYFWQRAIKNISLGVAFANKGVVILWTLMWSKLLYQEEIRINQIAGAFIIIIGVILVVKNDK